MLSSMLLILLGALISKRALSKFIGMYSEETAVGRPMSLLSCRSWSLNLPSSRQFEQHSLSEGMSGISMLWQRVVCLSQPSVWLKAAFRYREPLLGACW